MSWPQLLEMSDRQVFHSAKGAEIHTTWYVEPTDAAPAVFSALLGKVASDPANHTARTLPARDFEYQYCYCDEAAEVQFDPNQVSYQETTGWVTGEKTLAGIKTALQKSPDFQEGIDYKIMPINSKRISAGVYIKAIYRPAFCLFYTSDGIPETLTFDYLNPTWTPKHRTNLINAGLKIRAKPIPMGWIPGVGRLDFPFWPESGVAPVFEEQYFEYTVERRMIAMNRSIPNLQKYINHVNDSDVGMAGPIAVAGGAARSYIKETVKFTGYDLEVVRVPAVDEVTGNPSGWNAWQNYKLHFDIRCVSSKDTYSENGDWINAETAVGWNHMLVYPGHFRFILGALGNGGQQELGWYKVAYQVGLNNPLGGLIIDPKLQPYPADPIQAHLFEAQQ